MNEYFTLLPKVITSSNSLGLSEYNLNCIYNTENHCSLKKYRIENKTKKLILDSTKATHVNKCFNFNDFYST